jgi:hypothetical protein
VALTDEELLDFEEERLDLYDRAEALRSLAKFGDACRFELIAARWLEGYLERRLGRVTPGGFTTHSAEYLGGFEEAMRDVIAHLRQGDFLPGGHLYEDEVKRRR